MRSFRCGGQWSLNSTAPFIASKFKAIYMPAADGHPTDDFIETLMPWNEVVMAECERDYIWRLRFTALMISFNSPESM